MKDRIPTKPGRIKLTDENGVSKYYTLERADEPTEEGTPINKATLLSDDTANMLGLSDTEALPDIVFQRLTALAASGSSGNANDLVVEVGTTYAVYSASYSPYDIIEFKKKHYHTPFICIMPITTSHSVVAAHIYYLNREMVKYQVCQSSGTGSNSSTSRTSCNCVYLAVSMKNGGKK